MSAVSIVNKIYMLLRSMLVGIGQGFQPVAGYNYGAKLYKRVRKAFYTALVIGVSYGVLAASVLFLFGGNIVSIFRPGDTKVIETGTQMINYLCIPLLFLGFSTFVNQIYQSLGFVRPATFLASLRQGIFFVPFIFILPGVLGLQGILMTQAGLDVLTFAVTIPFYIRLLNKILSDNEKETDQ